MLSNVIEEIQLNMIRSFLQTWSAHFYSKNVRSILQENMEVFKLVFFAIQLLQAFRVKTTSVMTVQTRNTARYMPIDVEQTRD